MYEYKARIVRVIDGDTVELDVDMGFHITVRDKFRLFGLDTPERGQNGWHEATAFVESYFGQEPEVVINTYKQDKYGRWLADIRSPLGNLNKMLITSGLAKVYQ